MQLHALFLAVAIAVPALSAAIPKAVPVPANAPHAPRSATPAIVPRQDGTLTDDDVDTLIAAAVISDILDDTDDTDDDPLEDLIETAIISDLLYGDEPSDDGIDDATEDEIIDALFGDDSGTDDGSDGVFGAILGAAFVEALTDDDTN